MQKAQFNNAAVSQHQQTAPFVHDIHLRCTAVSSCFYRSLRSANPPPSLLLCVSDICTLILGENVRSVWIKYKNLNVPGISNVLCVLHEAHPRHLDSKYHGRNTNVTTPPSSTVSAGNTARAWQVRGVLLWLFIDASLESAIRHQSSDYSPPHLFCTCVCGVSRVSRAPRQTKTWIFGVMVKWSRRPTSKLKA